MFHLNTHTHTHDDRTELNYDQPNWSEVSQWNNTYLVYGGYCVVRDYCQMSMKPLSHKLLSISCLLMYLNPYVLLFSVAVATAAVAAVVVVDDDVMLKVSSQ